MPTYLNPFLLVLFLYSVLLILLGALLSRRVHTSSDFYVANRKLGPGLLFATLLAANIGAGSTVGAAGLGYRIGLSGWWWVGSAGLGSLVLAFAVGPRIRDLAARHNFLTVGDFLSHRYGEGVRVLVAVLLWGGTLFILAGQLIAVSWILQAIVGAPKALGCVLGGLVVIVYFSAGGLKGTVWINALQLTVKGAGFFLALPLALGYAGGWDNIQQRILEQGSHGDAFFTVTGIGTAGILSYIVLLAPSFIVSPGLLQKVYGARDAVTVRLGVGINAIVLLLYSFIPVVLGMAAASLFPGLDDPELALPYVMTQMLPFWLGALLLAAVFSAEVSSADAILFMLATSISKDLYKTFLNPEADDRTLFRVSRWVSVFSGAVGVLLAILLSSVIEALEIFYGLLSVALFAPLILGLYTKIRGRRTVVSAILVSVITAGLVHLATGGGRYWILSATAIGILVSFGVMFFGSALRGRNRNGAFDSSS